MEAKEEDDKPAGAPESAACEAIDIELGHGGRLPCLDCGVHPWSTVESVCYFGQAIMEGRSGYGVPILPAGFYRPLPKINGLRGRAIILSTSEVQVQDKPQAQVCQMSEHPWAPGLQGPDLERSRAKLLKLLPQAFWLRATGYS